MDNGMYASEYIFQVTEVVRKKSHPHREPQRAIKKQKSQIMSEQDHQRWGYSTVERLKKNLKKDKRKEQRNNYILIWGGSSSVSIFYVGLRAFGAHAVRM